MLLALYQTFSVRAKVFDRMHRIYRIRCFPSEFVIIRFILLILSIEFGEPGRFDFV
jgi:hypothetical protein